MIVDEPVCTRCKHFRPEAKGVTCDAFPGGIPDLIWIEGDPHSRPLPDQRNPIVFEPKEEDSAR